MLSVPPSPTIYEIPTRVWLESLRPGGDERSPSLSGVSEREWDRIASHGFDLVWLMGVWERSVEGRDIARTHPRLAASYREALPDLVTEDIVGSPYAVRSYTVDPVLGGAQGLARARDALRRRDVGLILDFVPNHVARDHPSVAARPETLIRGRENDLVEDPDSWFRAGDSVVAHGRDPYFAAWTDTAQINVFVPGAVAAAIRALKGIAEQCDGVRCDMAMLVTREIFARTWGQRAGPLPESEYWCDVLGAVRERYPKFLAIAEAYWDTEALMQDQGFDYAYDKGLYDLLVAGEPAAIRRHLESDPDRQARSLRFVENHDEPRAASTWSRDRERAVTVIAATLPGARLFHYGQFDGARTRVPVQLRRRFAEPVDDGMRDFFRVLLDEIRTGPYRDGTWWLLSVTGWPGDRSARNLLSWGWSDVDGRRRVVVVNLGEACDRGRVRLPWSDLAGARWRLVDRFGEPYLRDGAEMLDPGLFVELPPDGYHVLAVRRA